MNWALLNRRSCGHDTPLRHVPARLPRVATGSRGSMRPQMSLGLTQLAHRTTLEVSNSCLLGRLPMRGGALQCGVQQLHDSCLVGHTRPAGVIECGPGGICYV